MMSFLKDAGIALLALLGMGVLATALLFWLLSQLGPHPFGG